jgi:electron transport complex protein RnfC
MNIFSSLVPVKLDGHKTLTSHDAVKVVSNHAIQQVFISIVAPNGVEIELFVKEGDAVQVGTILGRRKDMYVPFFSSVSGKITAKVNLYNPVIGRATAHLQIDNDFLNTPAKPLTIYSFESSADDLIQGIKEAGITGLGGAGFPTYIKYEGAKGKPVDFVIINGVECEPYLSTDYHAAQMYALDVMQGAELLRLAAHAKYALIAFKNTKMAIKDALTPFLDRFPHVKIKTVPDAYPMGWETTLVKQLTGRTFQKLPIEAKCIVNNITTTMHVARALLQGKPILERIVTVSGEGIKHPANVKAPLGTLMSKLVEDLGGYGLDEATAFLGGPMSAKAIVDDKFALQPHFGAYTVLAPQENSEEPCLRCGACTAACPAFLQPIEIKNALDSDNTARLLKLDAMKCVECGICSYVCPSKIEVTEAVRKSKVKVRIAMAKAAMIKK